MKIPNKHYVHKTLSVLLLAGIFGIPLQSITLSSAAAPSSPLLVGKTAMSQKNYTTAVKAFESVVQKEPTNCEARLCLGTSLCKLAASSKPGQVQTQTYKRGASELRKAIRLGKGNKNSMAANAVLLSLPKNIVAPRSGADTPMIAMANGLRGLDRAAGDLPKPKILEFSAPWCEPCKQLKPLMEKVRADYKDKVEFVSYNVDDPQSEKVVEDYEVSPIPTLIFLDSSNQVVSYSLGYSGEAGLKQGLKKILPPVPPA